MVRSLSQFDISNTSHQRALLLVLVASAMGFTINLFPVYLFGDLALVFGPALSLLVAFTIGPWAGGFVAAVISIALIYSWQNYVGFFVFVPEAIIVGCLYRKGWNELFAVSVYWLAVCIPLAVVIYMLVDDAQIAFDFIGKYLMNSFIYTLVASALIWFFSLPRWLNLEYHRPFTLRTQIFTILMISMTLAVATISIYYAQQAQQEYIDSVDRQLKTHGEQISAKLDNLLESNKLAIFKQAEMLSLAESSQLGALQLAEFHQNNPTFSSLLIADPDGNIRLFSPPSFSVSSLVNISDRDYFRAAMRGEEFLSEAFRGRRVGTDPIVAISAPIYSKLTKQIVGILEGTLNLNDLKNIIAAIDFNSNSVQKHQVMITDAENKLVYATNNVNVELLHPIHWITSQSKKEPSFYQVEYLDEDVISSVTILTNRWQVRTMFQVADFTQAGRERYRKLAGMLVGIAIVVGLLAAFLSYQINTSVNWLLKRTLALNVTGEEREPVVISPYVPSEMATLMRAHETAERRLWIAFQTEKLHLQKRTRAEKANQAKSDFLSSMSHELRTPLNAISGFSQLLNLEESLSPESKDWVNEIDIASQHLLSLINDILDMSKIESGKLHLKKEKVDIKEVLEQSLPLLESKAAERNIQLKVNTPSEKIEVLADKLRLKQIIINLLSNAIKYNNKGGQVTIDIEIADSQSAALSITDTGLGIASGKLNELFQAFCRLDQEGSTIEGHGVGLAVTKKLIELMDGQINVRSELDKGSCFSVKLPLVKNRVVTASMPNQQTLKPAKTIKACRILYIEDNDVNALVMSGAMKRFPQIEFHRVSNGASGLRKIKQQYFDFIFLDISLPDMSGHDILAILLRDYKDQYQKVFAVSANAMSDDIAYGLSAGFDEYVTKPINFIKLFDLVKQYQYETKGMTSIGA